MTGLQVKDQKPQNGAEEMTALKGRFLAVLNHEIRTPLSGIMGMTDLLMETNLDEEQREYVAATRSCAETLFGVLNATLDYSALSSGTVTLEENEFNLSEVISAALSEHHAAADSKGLELYAAAETGLPETVIGDALRLRQILSHLISNGVKFTNSGHVELSIAAAPAGPGKVTLEFAVSDTGIGIDAAHLEHIFDSFQQVDNGLSRPYPGLGLGLALAQKLAELMGGELHAESAPGEGSTFVFQVSATVPDESQMVPVHTSALPGSARILLVEDNEVAQRIFSHVLRRGRYLVDRAASGYEAVQAARNCAYDLILMDLQMPGMNGIEATIEIRKLPGYAHTPIIALTANSAAENRKACLENGMQGFLLKPVPSDELLSAVAGFLRH
ncbi:MAG: response regulator [Bryobacteraceae bacterium]|nr:response regulator [Bryobacteraceae bacterium]